MSDRHELPSPFLTFNAGDEREFMADPFELWDNLLRIKEEVAKAGSPERFAFERAVVQWIDDTFATRLTIRQVNGLVIDLPKLCTEKKSDYSPNLVLSAEPADSTASASSDYPTANDAY